MLWRWMIKVWQMLAAVLHLSNTQFETVDDKQGDVAAINDLEVTESIVAVDLTEWSLFRYQLTLFVPPSWCCTVSMRVLSDLRYRLRINPILAWQGGVLFVL